MTTLRTLGLLTLVRTRGRGKMGQFSLSKMVCIVFVFCAATTMAASAQTLTTLYSFCPAGLPCADGFSPVGLVQATDGNFYATTEGGGAFSGGTVFKMTPGGTLTTLYSFCSQSNCLDGSGPSEALVQATDGNFYGTTGSGGANGYGTVFKITPGGTLTTLHSFDYTDGYGPNRLVQATDGNFYGTTVQGGDNCSGLGGCGTAFKMTPSGALTTLYTFCSQPNCADGGTPSPLVQATDGDFYGTTSYGGTSDNCEFFGPGCGTVFKMTPSGTLTTLHNFDYTDGYVSRSGLIQATDGNFYGTTNGGGANQYGTVFKITPTGTLTSLYSFCSQLGCTDGDAPYAGLVQATDGNFYGTTTLGGGSGCYGGGCGTVFKITPSGTLTTLHSFDGTDGYQPFAELVQATDGKFYGTTSGGGAYDYGTVFRLQLGPVPPCAICASNDLPPARQAPTARGLRTHSGRNVPGV
jgi:uncharacterized repeat protein (TIGR03803 family)